MEQAYLETVMKLQRNLVPWRGLTRFLTSCSSGLYIGKYATEATWSPNWFLFCLGCFRYRSNVEGLAPLCRTWLRLLYRCMSAQNDPIYMVSGCVHFGQLQASVSICRLTAGRSPPSIVWLRAITRLANINLSGRILILPKVPRTSICPVQVFSWSLSSRYSGP